MRPSKSLESQLRPGGLPLEVLSSLECQSESPPLSPLIKEASTGPADKRAK